MVSKLITRVLALPTTVAFGDKLCTMVEIKFPDLAHFKVPYATLEWTMVFYTEHEVKLKYEYTIVASGPQPRRVVL